MSNFYMESRALEQIVLQGFADLCNWTKQKTLNLMPLNILYTPF